MSGMRALKSRMESLVMQLLQEDYKVAFDGVRFRCRKFYAFNNPNYCKNADNSRCVLHSG